MAQFDVHRLVRGNGLVIDCQSDLLAHLDTRFVAPLVQPSDLLPAARRLNPVFQLEGAPWAMQTQAAAAIRKRDLGEVVASLADRDTEIVGAFDVLLTGV